MIPELFRQMLPPDWEKNGYVCPLPKTVLLQELALKRGDKTIIERGVKSASATVIRDDLWQAVPAAPDAQELSLFCIVMNPDCQPADRRRIQELLHAKLPHTLLLLVMVGEDAYLSARHGEYRMNLLLPAELPAPFLEALDIRHGAPANLRTLYNRWLCALYALDLAGNDKLQTLAGDYSFTISHSLIQAYEQHAEISSLLKELKSISLQLKQRNILPALRVRLGSQRKQLETRILNLITSGS